MRPIETLVWVITLYLHYLCVLLGYQCFFLKLMLCSRNHRLISEESVPSALALFDRPEPDLKATKAEKTAVAFG